MLKNCLSAISILATCLITYALLILGYSVIQVAQMILLSALVLLILLIYAGFILCLLPPFWIFVAWLLFWRK